jgi:hypothetical protein
MVCCKYVSIRVLKLGFYFFPHPYGGIEKALGYPCSFKYESRAAEHLKCVGLAFRSLERTLILL